MHHYVECGLNNVYLASGYNIDNSEDYGETIFIEDLEGLHRAIGDSIVRQHRTMLGSEFRFLRLELDMSQRALADALSTNEQSIAKWEKATNKPIANRSAERLLRIVYANKKRDSELERLIENITESDQSLDEDQVQFRRESNTWHLALAS